MQAGKLRAGQPRPTWLSEKVSNTLGKMARDVLYWEDPKISGGCLAAGLVFFFLKMWCRWSYATMFAGFIMVHMLLSMLYATFYSYSRGIHDHARHLKIDSQRHALFKANFDHIINQYNAWVDWYFELAGGRDVRQSLWVLGYCLILWIVTYFLSNNVQALLGFLLAFCLPKVYEMKHELIDDKVDNIKTQILELTETIMAKIPKATRRNENPKTR